MMLSSIPKNTHSFNIFRFLCICLIGSIVNNAYCKIDEKGKNQSQSSDISYNQSIKDKIKTCFENSANMRGKFEHIRKQENGNYGERAQGVFELKMGEQSFAWSYGNPVTRILYKTENENFIRVKDTGKREVRIHTPLPMLFLFRKPVSEWIDHVRVAKQKTFTNKGAKFLKLWLDFDYESNKGMLKGLETGSVTITMSLKFGSEQPLYITEWTFKDHYGFINIISLKDIVV